MNFSEKTMILVYDRVLVKPTQPTETGVIAHPENLKPGDFREGTVLSVGCGKRRADGKIQPLEVRAGDKILFRGVGSDEITLFGEGNLIMREKQILAVIE